jgi:hypothetical protein
MPIDLSFYAVAGTRAGAPGVPVSAARRSPTCCRHIA